MVSSCLVSDLAAEESDLSSPVRLNQQAPNPTEDEMRTHQITANLRVNDIDAARGFYADYLGLGDEEFNLGWVARFTSPDSGANVQLVTGDATAAVDSVISVHADDVDAAYAEALERGYEIVHPLTTEAWGARRFFVRDPDGNVINIVAHRE
jgi:predicted enzyme related to lactoylglutathione lyase